jgi:acetylornithine deacetylase/succinyl-diaminopimelate desuccinylase-like protein
VAYTVSPSIEAVFTTLLADPKIRKALAFIDADQETKNTEMKEMALVHGAPFKERDLRSPMFKQKLERHGATDCFLDAQANAFGRIRGGKGPLVVVEAHLDTVFDEKTPLAVTEKNGRIFCPGIGDDTAGLATVLSLLRAVRHAELVPEGSVLIGGTVGEEGEGDIRGIKGLLDDHKDVAAVVSVEPGPVADIVYGGVGSRRYEFVFRGPGGHSWSAFGLPSPIHAMGRAIAKMADVTPPSSPRTSCTVGVVSGGTSVNSIANEARCKLDMRSLSMESLAGLEKTMLRLVDEAVAEENAFRRESGATISVERKIIGDRPAGDQPEQAAIVQATWAAIRGAGGEPRLLDASSTNANAPISRGIPAVVVRTGGNTGGTHTPEEWFEPEGSQAGVKAALLLLFALTGLQGVTKPIALRERGGRTG